jgi:serine/threonine-protein kinase
LSSEDALPDRFGRYALIRKIGHGGMGEVFAARVVGVHGFEKTVAVKRILPSYASNPRFKRMLIDEAKISCLLNHPNIVQVLELGEVGGSLFLAMEYVAGRSLWELLGRLARSQTVLDPREAAFITIEVLQGLHAAHVQKDGSGAPANIVHRDISPHNVLIASDGLVKVIDFGIARARDRLEATAHGSIKGKLSYMAPEMLDADRLHGGEIDGRIDVFAAGAVLWEMIAGRPLFRRELPEQSVMAILEEPIPDLAADGKCDEELMAAVRLCLERDRDQRPNANEAAARLRAWLYKVDPAFTAERIAERMRTAFSDNADPLTSDSEAPASTPSGTRVLGGDEEKTRPTHLMTDVQRERHDTTASFVEPIEHTPGTPIGDLGDVAPTRTFVVAKAGDDAPLLSTPRVAVVAGTPPPSRSRSRGRRRKPLAAVLTLSAVLGVVGSVGLIWWAEQQKTPEPAEPPLDEPAPSPADDAPLALVVTTAPPTARLFRSDADAPPQDAPGRYEAVAGDVLEITARADGYAPRTERIRVPEEENAPSFHIALEPSPVALELNVEPAGATVTVDGERWTPGLQVVPGRPVHVVAELDGQRVETRAIAELSTPLAVSLTVPPAPVAPLPVEPVEQVTEPEPKRTTQRTRRRRSSRSEAPKGSGTLVLTTAPNWATVFIDGRRLKNATPVREKLRAGTHKVRLENKPAGLSRTLKITIEPDKETKRHVRF